jgi:hypothetical protein
MTPGARKASRVLLAVVIVLLAALVDWTIRHTEIIGLF